MAGQWLHLAVSGGLDIVVPLASVSRVLHRDDPEYSVWAEGAVPLAERLGVGIASGLPGVVVLASAGGRWLAGDARVDTDPPGVFHPVPPWLFERQPPWCRGVLWRDGGWSFVADPSAWEDGRA